MTASGQSYIRALRDADKPASAFATVGAALSDPAVLFYGSILHCPGFRVAVSHATAPQDASTGKALEAALAVMSYGTIGDATGGGSESSGNLSKEDIALAAPVLTDDLREKLRMLSILSFYSRHGNGRSEVPYGELQAFLGLADTDALEDTVALATSSHLLKARLNPRNGTVCFLEISQGRDVSPGELADLQAKLKAWGATCDRQLKQLDRAMEACGTSDSRVTALAHSTG